MFRRPTKKRKVADAPYTELGEKYGHPVGPNHVAISQIRPWRSGITPLEPGPFKTEAARLEYIKLQNYQRDRFEGKSDRVKILGWMADGQQVLLLRTFTQSKP
jgi:hypothetical protein